MQNKESVTHVGSAAIGSNRLVKHDTLSILESARDALDACDKPWQVPELWDGHAAERVAAVLKSVL